MPVEYVVSGVQYITVQYLHQHDGLGGPVWYDLRERAGHELRKAEVHLSGKSASKVGKMKHDASSIWYITVTHAFTYMYTHVQVPI